MKLRVLLVLALLLFSVNSWSDWRSGKVKQLNVAYDGHTITFLLEGWVRTNCTCYSTWPNTMCLVTNRATHDFEKAMLLSARARGTKIYANIDETTCSVQALYEITE